MSSLSRGLEIIEYVSAHQSGGVSYPQILSHTGFPASSCFRILKELTELSYLTFDEDTRKYYVSLKLAGIGSAAALENNISKLLHPYLEKLRDESNKTCNLGVLNNDSGIFLDVLYSHSNTIKLLSRMGASFPLHCTALGKVLLAYAKPNKRDALLSTDLQPLTPRSITSRVFLEKQLEQVVVDGYATEHEESTMGIHCFAAPIFNYEGDNIAAISMACPYFDFELPGTQEKLIDLIKSHSAMMSEVMGYRRG